MLSLLRRAVVTLLLIVSITVSLEGRQSKEGTASISGRVTVAGKPARGVAVTLKESTNNDRRALQMLLEGVSLEKASTDEEGRYRFDGVVAGRYEIVPYAPSLILADGKTVPITITDGERVEDIDFTLSKGGAITGRVTGPDGRPLIMESVRVARTDTTNSNAASGFSDSSFATDDRGIYRVYGLPPGHYKVSTGRAEARFDAVGLSFKRPDHPQTFHPGVTDETKAAIVEVAAGGEAANTDIKVGVAKKTYKVTGRVIEIATGKPLPNAMTSYMVINGDGSSIPRNGLGSPSSSTGEFRLEGLTTGRYAAFALFGLEGSSEYYSEMLNFEIKSEDLSGLEIRVHRGGSISGIAVVDGINDPAVLERMARTEIFAMVTVGDGAPNFSRSKIAEDGSFQLRGLKSGKVRIMLQDFLSQSGLSLQRVERGGVQQQPDGIDLAADEHITDVRLVFAHASGVIRGQVNVEGGALPKEAELSVVARRKANDSNPSEIGDDSEVADIDAAKRFVVESLVPGEYEVTVTVVLNPNAPANRRQVRQAREQVTVTGGSTAEIVIVLDLSKGAKRIEGFQTDSEWAGRRSRRENEMSSGWSFASGSATGPGSAASSRETRADAEWRDCVAPKPATPA